MKLIRSCSLLLALLAVPSLALADTTPEDRASADQLYNDASKLMAAGSYAEACPKLGASQKLDPAIGTLLKLGFCFTYTGQTASAWASFNDAEAMARKAGDTARGDEAAKRAHDLEAKLSKLSIEIASTTSTAADVEVQRDGVVIDPGVLGTALPVDPGEHAIRASAPGMDAWTSTVTIPPGPGTTTVRVPALTPSPGAATAVVPGAPAGEAPKAAPASTGWSTQRKVGLGVGAVGVAGVVVGAVFGAMTLSKTSAAADHCSGDAVPECDPEGLTLYGDANTTANVSNIAMAVGGAALIGGVVLFVTGGAGDPPAKAVSGRVTAAPWVGAATGGVLLQGVW